MARIEPIPPREWPPEMRAALGALTPPSPPPAASDDAPRSKALNLLGTFALHPALTRSFFVFNGHILAATTLTARQRELLVLRVGVRRSARYEWGQHLPIAGDAGLSREEIDRVGSDPASDEWSDLEAALLRAVDELIDDGVISDHTWNRLAADLDPRQLLDVIFTVGAYETLGWMMRSFEIDLDDDLLAVIAAHTDG